MKITEAIDRLSEIKTKFGDLPIVGGYLADDTPPREICVVNEGGLEIFPSNPNGVGQRNAAGVFISL